MANRAIDFYIKRLELDIRQDIFKKLEDIGVKSVEKLLEKNDGYPTFKKMKYTEEQIDRQVSKSIPKFQQVNQVMIDNERYPLFSKPEDTYKSAIEYVNLLKKKTKEELLEEFGCDWENYVPKKYSKELNDNKKKDFDDMVDIK